MSPLEAVEPLSGLHVAQGTFPEFIAECYRKRFHRERPAQVVPLAEVAKRQQQSARDKARHA